MQSASSGGTINEKQNKKYHDNTVFCTDIVICLVQQQKVGVKKKQIYIETFRREVCKYDIQKS